MPARRRWGLARVSGESMTPTLRAGDWLLVDYRGALEPGALAVADFPDGTLVVKRVARSQQTAAGHPGWYLLSDNPGAGVDSRHRGPISESAIRGVVAARLWPRPARRRALPGRTAGSG